MKTIWVLLKKDYRVFLRDRTAVALTFAVPAILIMIFGLVFGGSEGGDSGVRLLVVDEALSEASSKIAGALKEEKSLRVTTERSGDPPTPLTRERVTELLRTDAGSWRHALILPKDFIGGGFGFHVELLQNPQYPFESEIVNGLIQKTLFMEGMPVLINHFQQVADEELGAGAIADFNDALAAAIANSFSLPYDEVREDLDSNWLGAFGDASLSEGGEDETNLLSQIVDIQTHEIYGQGKNPAVQSVGGWAVMFLLFSLSASAASLMVEKREGLFMRLLSGPVTRQQILWSKYLFCATLGFLQMGALLGFGQLMYGIIEGVNQILPLALISIAGALSCSAFGMILAAFSKTEAQANGLATLLILSMSALGGAMFPVFMLPAFIQDVIAPLTLVYWVMDGIYGVLWRDAGLAGVGQPLLVLGLIAVVCLPVAIWRFRTGDLFK